MRPTRIMVIAGVWVLMFCVGILTADFVSAAPLPPAITNCACAAPNNACTTGGCTGTACCGCGSNSSQCVCCAAPKTTCTAKAGNAGNGNSGTAVCS
jgi:hypothetical protein